MRGKKFKICLCIAVVACFINSHPAWATDLWVKGYTTVDGTYVEPHYLFRSNSKKYQKYKINSQAYFPLYYHVSNAIPRYSNNPAFNPSQKPIATRPEHSGRGFADNEWICVLGYKKVENRCEKILVPANAKLNPQRSHWECLYGYRQIDNRCERIPVPAHARLDFIGQTWQCNIGYKRKGDRCEKVFVPDNAKLNVLANSWYCKFGYRQVGNQCLQVHLPRHARYQALGNAWECKHGYILQQGNCHKIVVPSYARLTTLGDDWYCRWGFRRQGEMCVAK